ncbi:glycosyltransferase family 39 protein [Oculatella sp. LEGE 06141]|uniref:glycosyltransferase family 39 protein n=1 Tax=Oculatella sp. LEGE 06141 TaxID=1828648 RepID=UPI00187F08C2|nr:glycosyltransferase family 39 protein [Oculatella sp. LEGE 06141]MBE9177362.1 glycosyltransferase family 39 protein [Oculatella sp. LEGE 06141]
MKLSQLAAHSSAVQSNTVLLRAWLVITIVVIIGVFFRLVDLDWRVLTNDETLTFLRISGYSKNDLFTQVFNGQVITLGELQQYQRPHFDRSLLDAIRAFVGHPEHPPLYYLMARFWVQLFGSSVEGLRSLSALISLLALPCIYWLCLELFGSALVGGMAIALVAVSPMHLFHAQSARQNSAWIVMILLSSWLLLRSIRLRTPSNWWLYAATVAVGLYTHLFFGFTLLGHGIYVLWLESGRLSRVAIAYLRATLIGIVVFTPWIAVIAVQWRTLPNRTARDLPVLTLVQRWAVSLNDVFFNLDDLRDAALLVNGVALMLVLLVGYSLYLLCRDTPKPVWLFIVIQIAVPLLLLIGPDLILGGQRSATGRYLIPAFLGMQLAVAYCMSVCITTARSRMVPLYLCRSLVVLLISGGILTELLYQGGPFKAELRQTAWIANQADRPLLISDADAGITVLPLSYQLNPTVQLLLVKGEMTPTIPDRFTDVLLFRPSDGLKTRLQQHNYRLVSVKPSAVLDGKLWRVEPALQPVER